MTISDIKGTIDLSNGVKMPYFGLGVFQSREGSEVMDAIQYALDAGYRHIDTASIYQNERGVGLAVRNYPINRNEVFITSKVWNSDQGYDSTIKAFNASLKRLDMEYLDLYLVHWPVKGKYKETYKALETLYEEGRARAIGVSNFLPHHIEDILSSARIVPMVNQVEFHPYLVQPKLLEICQAHNIKVEAWSPLMQGKIMSIPVLQNLAAKYYKTVAQIVLRWNLQKGIITIPKSVNQNRIVENSQIFDFSISNDDMIAIDALDRNQRIGADPDNFNF